MTHDKPVEIKMTAGGKTYETVIEPGDTPRDVLARVVDGSPDEFLLRRKTGPRFGYDIDLFSEVETGETLRGATNPIVGHR